MKNEDFNMDDYLLFEKPKKVEVSKKDKIIYQIFNFVAFISLITLILLNFSNDGITYKLICEIFILLIISNDFYKIHKSIYKPNLVGIGFNMIFISLFVYEIYSIIW